uniref:Uncharacterized protein n=1 Tax=Tetranychus urticae TaxID=32264 RepID=T1L4F5_TETUR
MALINEQFFSFLASLVSSCGEIIQRSVRKLKER